MTDPTYRADKQQVAALLARDRAAIREFCTAGRQRWPKTKLGALSDEALRPWCAWRLCCGLLCGVFSPRGTC